MRYHKRKDGRRLVSGVWHSTVDVYQKVVTTVKEVTKQAVRNDVVGRQLEDGKKVKALVATRRIKNKRLEYRLTIGDEENIWVDAEPWKVIIKVLTPLRILHNSNWKGSWNGKWELLSSTLMPPLNKSVIQRQIMRMR